VTSRYDAELLTTHSCASVRIRRYCVSRDVPYFTETNCCRLRIFLVAESSVDVSLEHRRNIHVEKTMKTIRISCSVIRTWNLLNGSRTHYHGLHFRCVSNVCALCSKGSKWANTQHIIKNYRSMARCYKITEIFKFLRN
jgi:hypothetical protein